MILQTHLKIDVGLCGSVTSLNEGSAAVELVTVAAMAADERGLVHGGFIFGAADYAAMAAVNEPTVVLASSSCKFLAPSRVGDVIVFNASVSESEGKKHKVNVSGISGEMVVFKGEFTCIVTPRHVLD